LVVALSVGLVCNCDFGFAAPPQAATQNPISSELHITVLEGEDGANILKTKMAVKPVVEVRDKNNLPVAGVSVVFTAPGSGPRVVFSNGSNTFMTTTNASGRAQVSFSRPIGRGHFSINVSANAQGHVFTAAISQTNFATAAAAAGAGGAAAGGAAAGAGGAAAAAGISGAVIGGIVAAAAAVAVGLAVGLTRKSTPTGTIGAAGTPTLSH
jgi:hypothetical protein